MSGPNSNGDKTKKFNTLVELEDTASQRRVRRPTTSGNIDSNYIIGMILTRYSTDNVFRMVPSVNLRVTDPEFFRPPQGENDGASPPLSDKTNTAYTLHANKGWKLNSLNCNPSGWNKTKSADECLDVTVDDIEVKTTMDYLNIIGLGGRITELTANEDADVALEEELNAVDAHFMVPDNMHFRPPPAVRRISGEVIERTYGVHPRKLRKTSGNYVTTSNREPSRNYETSGVWPVLQRRTSSLYKVMTINQVNGDIVEEGHDDNRNNED